MSDPFDSRRISEDFERDGFVLFENFLDPPTLGRINRELAAHYDPLLAEAQKLLDSRPENMKQFECDVIPWSPVQEGNQAFIELHRDPRLAQVTQACIGEGFTATSSLVMASTAGGKGQAWHQDCPPRDGQFNLNRLFYTRDVQLDDGAIVIVPGSHRRGRIPSGGNQEPIPGELVLTPKAGTLILLSGHVYHRVTPNTSRNPRISVNFRAFPAGVSTDVCGVGIYRGAAYNFRKGEVVTETTAPAS